MEGKVFVIMALPARTLRREALSGIMFLLNQRHRPMRKQKFRDHGPALVWLREWRLGAERAA
jgi:hypothetical protein